MASVVRFGKRWRAHVARQGVRKSKVFNTRQEARDWAAQAERGILAGRTSRDTLAEVMDRYSIEVSPRKRGARWERIRLDKLRRDKIAGLPIADITAADISDWRDRRLRDVGPGTVRREMGLIAAVFSRARDEWGLIAESPMRAVRKPAAPRARDRRPTADELARMEQAATGALRRAYDCFLFSIETGMRAGEVCGLRPDDINGRVARLAMTKNGTARQVPLSSEALRILARYDGDPVFSFTPRQLDANFRRLKAAAGVEGLTYHDSRHEATTRLARVLEPLELARMLGHRNLNELLTYYNESAEDIAGRLG